MKIDEKTMDVDQIDRCRYFSPRVETNSYLKQAGQMSKSLIIASTQRTDFGLMVVSQWMTMPRVVAEP